MNTSDFDDIIKDKLDQPVKLEDPRAWDLFMLQAIEKGEEELFEDKSADILIKNALKDFKVEYKPETWDALEQKISQDNQEPVLATRFDKEVSNSLKSLKRKYDAATWPRLAARIEAEERYLKHYYHAKVVEALLFLLLVVTLFQFTQSESFNNESNNSINTNIVHLNSSEDFKSTENGLKSVTLSAEIPSIDLKSRVKGLLTNKGVSSINEPNNLASISNAIHLKPFKDYTNLTRLPIDIYALSPALSFQIVSYDKENEIQNKIEKLSLATASSSKKIAAEWLPANQQELTNDWAILSVPDLITKIAEDGHWRVGMYARADYNEIRLPAQTIYEGKTNPFPAKTVKSEGYGVGFKATYTRKHIGFETGLGYANRSYAPDRRYFGEKYYNYNFANIEYNIVEFPISVRFGSTSKNRLTSYIQAGINMNFIAQAIYDVKAEYRSVATALGSGNTQDDQYQLSRFRDLFSKFDKRRALIYAQGAVGAEWRANQNVNIYSQLTFGQQFLNKQFGPNFDQAKSLSLEFGLRTKI